MRHKACVPVLVLFADCALPPPSPQPAPDATPHEPRIVVGTVPSATRLIRQVKPVYPRKAKENRIQGTVRLRAMLTKSGEVRDLQVLEGHTALVPATLAAVRQWPTLLSC